jgi:hypothetical protein
VSTAIATDTKHMYNNYENEDKSGTIEPFSHPKPRITITHRALYETLGLENDQHYYDADNNEDNSGYAALLVTN